MVYITFKVLKEKVLDEIGRTTSYVGAKWHDDAQDYDRVYTTDADQPMLERFWNEACTGILRLLKEYLISAKEETDDNGSVAYIVEIMMPRHFDEALKDSIEKEMFSYFVDCITGEWMNYIDKDKAKEYTDRLRIVSESLTDKIYSRKRPKRSEYI